MNTTKVTADMQLDEYDYRLIQACKSEDVTLQTFMAIWADRCGMDIEYVDLADINQHLVKLVENLGLLKNVYGFIVELDPVNNWKYLCNRRSYLDKNTTNFDLILFSRIDSAIRLTEVKYFPGYRDYVNNGFQRS